MPITRFAPSPTGFLHIGHAYSARMGFEAARRGDPEGRFLLRIEDIDRTRCRREFETALLEDLAFLGLSWDGPVRRQSEHLADYEAALARLEELGVLYPCFCTRAEIAAEIAQAQGAPHDLPAIRQLIGPAAELPSEFLNRYPGTCRARSRSEAAARLSSGANYALRLDVEKALQWVRAQPSGRLVFFEERFGEIEARPELFGDVVLARKDIRTSYHLAVTVDDHLQGVTLITRGEDLYFATHIHRLLQALLGLRTPRYAHHPLLFDKDGQRLAKRHGARSLRDLRGAGLSAAAIWATVGLPPLAAS